MSIVEPQADPSARAEPAAPGPLHRRIVETFFSPADLFARFGPSPPWLDVAIVAAVLMAVSAAVVPAEAYEQMMREQFRNAAAGGAAGAPDPATMVPFARIMGVVSMIFYPIIGAVIVGGLLKLAVGVLLGGEATYQQYLGVYAHAALIVALGSLVTLPIIIMSGDMMRQLNLALLVPDAEHTSFMFRFLSQFGIFSIWQYAVVGLGAAAVNRGRVTAAATYGAVATIYLVMALVASVMPTGG